MYHVPQDAKIKFDPFREASEFEKSQIAANKVTAIVNAFSANLIPQDVAVAELAALSADTNIFGKISEEHIRSGVGKYSSDLQAMQDPFGGLSLTKETSEPEEFAVDSDFDESKHPRAENGQFTKSGSGGSSKTEEPDEKIKEDDNTAELTSEQKEVLGEEFRGYKGQKAINKIYQEKRGHVRKAFHRKDIGYIDIVWGDSGSGLQHIIEQRKMKDPNVDIDEFISSLGDVIEKGRLDKINDRGRFEILYDNKMAIISSELRDGKLTYLFTAFKTRKK